MNKQIAAQRPNAATIDDMRDRGDFAVRTLVIEPDDTGDRVDLACSACHVEPRIGGARMFTDNGKPFDRDMPHIAFCARCACRIGVAADMRLSRPAGAR